MYAVIGPGGATHLGACDARPVGGGPRSQMLKYTSRRRAAACRREIQFNDVRTTLQALYALFDTATACTPTLTTRRSRTPTEESVRRAVAIQLIINKELGLNKTQNRGRAPSRSRN